MFKYDVGTLFYLGDENFGNTIGVIIERNRSNTHFSNMKGNFYLVKWFDDFLFGKTYEYSEIEMSDFQTV